jgi:transposase-like protein
MPEESLALVDSLRLPAAFRWTEKKSAVAIGLAEGQTQKDLAKIHGINARTIRAWLAEIEFKQEVDRLSLMMAAANRAERLRIASRVIRIKTLNDRIQTDRDLLDWLKYAQTETDGINLNLDTALIAALALITRRDETRDHPTEPSAA